MKAVTLMMAFGIAAALPAQAADPAALFVQKGCATCHGESGRKPAAVTPVLAGQNAVYLLRQMNEIAEGIRSTPGAQPMKPFIAKTSSEERQALAGWLAAQTYSSAASPPASPPMLAKGEELFDEQGCIGCHGAKGAKPLADYPILAGQRKDYLTAQVKAIRDELRATRRARMMVSNVRMLKDGEVDALAEYLSQSKRN